MKRVKSNSKRKRSVKTPSSLKVTHYQKRRTNFPACGKCGRKLQGAAGAARIKKSRPYSDLCSACAKRIFVQAARG